MSFSKLIPLLCALLLLAFLIGPPASAGHGGPITPASPPGGTAIGVLVPNASPPPPGGAPPTTDNGGTRTRTKRSIRSRSVRTTPPPPGG